LAINPATYGPWIQFQGADKLLALEQGGPMPLDIEPVTRDFAAIVRGLDLHKPLPAADRDAIVKASDRYTVLVFPGQPLTKDELLAFAASFGAIDSTLEKKLTDKVQRHAVTGISNVDDNGKVAGPDDFRTINTVTTRFWHSDSSYRDNPTRYSFLNAVTAVSYGGETQFADLRAAYDALDDITKALIADKVGVFWSHNTRDFLKVPDTEDVKKIFPKARWPLVRTHPGSGRKVLWCDSKVYAIEGMSLPEGRALAQELIEHSTQRERVYTHKWKPGDLIMYDNRAALHRGRRFIYSEHREMNRIEVADDSHSLGTV
jgi:alpha-ketoglutarate-dependent 2,4-dichlorophenoxyacetate dioxygenase